MRRPHGGRYGIEAKALNKNLGPLKRFLESRIGQPWNRVFSEIAARVRPTSATQLHILTHVRELVCEAPEMRGGVPYRLSGRPAGRLWRGRLYVEPGTGILRRTPDHRRIGERSAKIVRLP